MATKEKRNIVEKLLIVPVITHQALASKTEELVRNDNLTYLEAIIQICDELDVDPEDIAKMVYASSQLSPQACVEDIIIRPQEGDL